MLVSELSKRSAIIVRRHTPPSAQDCRTNHKAANRFTIREMADRDGK
jgi:hypothetical protein